MDSEAKCRHDRILRNCYECHLEYMYPKEKNPLDALHETISELKIRVSKLEEYKRLQEDFNNSTNKDIYNLNDHRRKQIDENRAAFKHLTAIDTDMTRWETTQTEQNKKFSEQISLLETFRENQQNVNVILLDKFKRVIKDEITKIHEDVSYTAKIYNRTSDNFKTSGLTFEQAITAFKAGKNIRFNDGFTTSTIYYPRKEHCYGFAFSYICQDHWEIIA